MWAFHWSSFCYLAWVSRVVLVTKKSRSEHELGQKFLRITGGLPPCILLPFFLRFVSHFRFWATMAGDGEFIMTFMRVMSSATYLFSSHSHILHLTLYGIVHSSPFFACLIDIYLRERTVICVGLWTSFRSCLEGGSILRRVHDARGEVVRSYRRLVVLFRLLVSNIVLEAVQVRLGRATLQ